MVHVLLSAGDSPQNAVIGDEPSTGTGMSTTQAMETDRVGSTQVGFAVPRAVGNAVVRNRVRRRLRHLIRERLDQLPGPANVVVRALPGSDRRTFDELGHDLDRALTAAMTARRRSTTGQRGGPAAQSPAPATRSSPAAGPSGSAAGSSGSAAGPRDSSTTVPARPAEDG